MLLRINESQHGPITVVEVGGMIRMGAESLQLKEKIDALVAEDKTNLVLDIAEVSYIDSHGIGEFVACLTTMRKSGGNLALANPSDFVADVLKATRLDKLLTPYDSVEEALRDLRVSDQQETSE